MYDSENYSNNKETVTYEFQCTVRFLLERCLKILFCNRTIIHSQRSIHMAVMIYKSLNGLAPDYLSAKFLDRSSVCNYSLRDTEGKLAVPMPHTNYMKNSFSYSGAVLWNSLPIELRQANSLTAFRAGCERFFSSNEL